MPRVSIIIATRNRAGFLPRAVESARRAGASVEVIVVDDASSDETAAVCRALEGIKYIRLGIQQGMAGSRNVGILASSADYIAFLDDDDLRLPGSLDVQAEALDKDCEAGLVCGAMLLADQSGQLTGEVSTPVGPSGDLFWNLLELGVPAMPLSVMIRKECFSRVGLLNQSLPILEDWDIFVRIAELYSVIVLSQPVGIYRNPTPRSGQSSSAQARLLHGAARHQLELFRLPRARSAPPGKLREVRRRALNRISDTLLWNARRTIPENKRFACSNILTALRVNPLCVLRPPGYRKLASIFSGRKA